MKSDQLITELLQEGEGEQLEFKSLANSEDIGKIICSFLNNEGGQILIGVSDNKKILGVRNAKKVCANLQNHLIIEIIPEAVLTISIEIFKGKELILIKVRGGSQKPYIYKGGIFFRKKDSTVQASSKQISDLIHVRQVTETRWERQIVPEVTFRDLDTEEIKLTITEAIKSGRTKKTNKSITDFLSYYGLIQNGNFTNAAILLFAKEPARFIPQCKVRLSIFPENKTGSTFLYDRIFDKNIFKNTDDIETFFDVNIGISSSFKKNKWKRKDKLNYPKEALREALLNALIHRDYSNVSGSVLVAFYMNRLEISSYGSFPKEITPALLKRSHLSIPVNPDIAQICFLRGAIEKIGRGTLKIIEQTKELGFKEPFWANKNNITTITFPGITTLIQKDSKIKGINNGLNDVINDLINDGVNDGINDGVFKAISDGVKLELMKVIKAILDNPGLIAEIVAKTIKKPKPTTERYIKLLRELGFIEFKGSRKTGGYQITRKFLSKIE